MIVYYICNVQRNLRDLAELYGCELSLQGVEEHRKVSGLELSCSTCFKAARISAILIDDGFELDKMYDIEWHKSFVPLVGRILRIERVAEKILDQVRYALFRHSFFIF
jgi:hypothetical protein